MLTALARRVAKPLLENALGAYLPEELDLNQLELHVPDGRLRLRSLALHAEELNRSFFPKGPAYVQTAVIAELMSEVPYKQLATQPCRLEARGVHIRMALGCATLGPSPQELSMLLDVLPSTPPSMKSAAATRPDMNTTAIDSLTHFLERLLLQLHLSASDITIELQANSGAIFQLRIPELNAEAKRLELKRGAEIQLIPPGLKSTPICLARLEPGSAAAVANNGEDNGSLSIEATFAALRLLVAPLQLQELLALLQALKPKGEKAKERDEAPQQSRKEDERGEGEKLPKKECTPVETALDDQDRGVIALLQAGLVPDADPDDDYDLPDQNPLSDSQFKEARGPAVVSASEPSDAAHANAAAPALPPRVSLTLTLDSVCVSLVSISSPTISFLPWNIATSPCLSHPNNLSLCASSMRLTASHHADASTFSFSIASCTASLYNQHPTAPPSLRLLSLSDSIEEELEAVLGESGGNAQPPAEPEPALFVSLSMQSRPVDSEDAVEQRQVQLRAPRLALFYQPVCLPLLTPYAALFSTPPPLSPSVLPPFPPQPQWADWATAWKALWPDLAIQLPAMVLPALKRVLNSAATDQATSVRHFFEIANSGLPDEHPFTGSSARARDNCRALLSSLQRYQRLLAVINLADAVAKFHGPAPWAIQQTNIRVSVGRLSVSAEVVGEGRLLAELSGLSLQGISANETKLLGEADALLLSLRPSGRDPPILLAEAALRHSSDAAPTPLELTLRPAPPPTVAAPSPTNNSAANNSNNKDGAVPMQGAAEGPFSAFMSSFEGRRARRVEAREDELARFRHESVAAAAAVIALALPTLRLDVPLARVPLLRRILAALSATPGEKPGSEKSKSTESKPEDLPRAAAAVTVGDATVVVRGEKGETIELNGEGLRVLLSLRHNGGVASYAALALASLSVCDSDPATPVPAPFLFSVPRLSPDAPPALSLAAELPLAATANSTPHDVLFTMRGVAFDATPRTRPASLLYVSLTSPSQQPQPSSASSSTSTPSPSLPVIVLAPPSAAPPPLPKTPSPAAPPVLKSSSSIPSTTLPSVYTSLLAEDAWVWIDSAPRNGPCARLAVRLAKLDIQPQETNTLLLFRGASFFLRADAGGQPLATEGSRPAGGSWANIGGADFLQLVHTPMLVSVQCPALKLAFCADSYASLIALSSSFSALPSSAVPVSPVQPFEVKTLSVLDLVDEAAFAPPASAAPSGLIEDYAGEQNASSPSLYGSVLLSAAASAGIAAAHGPSTPVANPTSPVRRAPAPTPSAAPSRPPARGFAEAQAALRAEAPRDPRHAAPTSHIVTAEEDKPRLEPIDPSGAPKAANPLADLLRRMNLSRLLPAFTAHGIDLEVLRAIVQRGQEADLAAMLRLTPSEQAQVTAAVRSLGPHKPPSPSQNNGAIAPSKAQAPSAAAEREQYRRDSGAKWLGPAPEVIEEYAPSPPPQGATDGQWKLHIKDSSILLRFYTGEDFGAGRDAAHVECRLEELLMHYTSYDKPALGSPTSSMELSIGELNAIDALQPKGPAGFALRLLCADPALPRVLNTPVLHVQWRLIEATPEPEHWLHIHATPLSSHLTQAAWEFLANFFSGDSMSSSRPPAATASTNGPFIQRCQMAPLSLKLSYEPEITRGIDVGLLRQGATSELLKLVPLKNSQFRFAAVDVTGVMGWMSLYNHIKLHWLAAMYTQHVFSYAAGVTAVHHVGQVAEGLYELVYTPFAQSRRDGRLVLGLQRGAAAAFRTLLSEAAALGLSLASGAHKLVGGTATPAPPSASAGLQAAYGAMARQAKEAGAVVSIPLVEYQRTGTTGLVRAVLRAVPVLLLLPARGLTETAQQTLAGLREQLEGAEFHAKFTPHNG